MGRRKESEGEKGGEGERTMKEETGGREGYTEGKEQKCSSNSSSPPLLMRNMSFSLKFLGLGRCLSAFMTRLLEGSGKCWLKANTMLRKASGNCSSSSAGGGFSMVSSRNMT